LGRHSPANDPGLYGRHIPDVDDEKYPEVLMRLKRVNDKEGLYSVAMPIRVKGENVALLIGETSRSFAFRESRHLMLTGILRLLGKYMWEYR